MYETIKLPNGVRILTQAVAGVRSASLGIWVGTGARHEKAGENGSAHFIEHMVFKGTDRRTAAQLAEEMDGIGGQINAFTTKECTCFYGRVLDTHLPTCADILCDMLFHSKFDEEDVATERGVILEEIGMYKDNPEDLCSERLAAAVYKGSPLARPILGTPATLKKMTGAGLKAYMESHYCGHNMVVALAGSFQQSDVDYLKEQFGKVAKGRKSRQKEVAYVPSFTVKKKAIEQNHLTLAFPSITYDDDRRFVMQLLSSMLGSGMSSRLWQEVREKRGLCYSIYSFGSGHKDCGMFGIYTALGRETEEEALTAIAATIRTFVADGVTQGELDRAREQSKANVILGLESTQAHMSQLGRGELMQGQVMGADEIIAAYDAITVEDIHQLSQEIFNFENLSLSAVGRVATVEEYRTMLGV